MGTVMKFNYSHPSFTILIRNECDYTRIPDAMWYCLISNISQGSMQVFSKSNIRQKRD